MKEHKLKTWPSFFEAVSQGRKTFEVRLNDRDFTVGDVLILEEWDPTVDFPLASSRGYTGKRITKHVTYVMQGGKFGLDALWCVLGLGKIEGGP